MRALPFICLYILNKLNGERSVSAIYHLLKGKKSSQTIQDGKLFGLHTFFGTLPNVSRELISEAIENLENDFLIILNNQGHYTLTEKGKQTLSDLNADFQLPPHLNGWQYHKLTSLFWRRFSLLIQTLSNIIHKHSNFLPVQTDVDTQSFVKKTILSKKASTQTFSKRVHYETEQLFSLLTEQEATILAYQLSGYEEAGLTISQLAKRLNLEEVWSQLLFIGAIHHILFILHHNKEVYPELHALCEDVLAKGTYTVTTEKTRRLLVKGFSIEQIAQIRNLKVSTIEDHVVEISLHDQSFSINDYISNEQRKEIEKAINQLNTKRLKLLKEFINNDDIDYFQIRLVLTKIGDRIES